MKNSEIEAYVRKYDLYEGRGLQYDLIRRVIVDTENQSLLIACQYPTFFDVGYFYCPYIPVDRKFLNASS